MAQTQTCSLFFGSLNAASPISCVGTILFFGRTLDIAISILTTNFGGTIFSEIYENVAG